MSGATELREIHQLYCDTVDRARHAEQRAEAAETREVTLQSELDAMRAERDALREYIVYGDEQQRLLEAAAVVIAGDAAMNNHNDILVSREPALERVYHAILSSENGG